MERKELKTYSREYWQTAQAEVDRPIHRCCICFRVRGEVANPKRNALAHGSDPSVRRVEVRLVEINGVPRMACKRCVPDAREIVEDKALIRKLTPSLFGDEGR